MDSKTKIGLGVGGFVVALGAAVGVGALAANLAGSDTASASQSSGASTQGTRGSGSGSSGQGRGGFDTTAMAEQLATELGVDKDKVAAALKEVMEASRPSGAPSGTPSGQPSGNPSSMPTSTPSGAPADGKGSGGTARTASMAKALAEKLGLDEAKVLAALQKVMPSGVGGGQASGEPSK